MNLITETNLEQGTYAAFAAWLAFYFDGGSHGVGAGPAVTFPKAALGFAQAMLPQPLAAPGGTLAGNPVRPTVGIIMTFGESPGPAQRRWDTVNGSRQQMFYKPVRWNFWVRAETADDQARAAVMSAGQLLEALLANAAASRPLAQCGIHRIRPGTSYPVADTTFVLRMVACRAVLKYAVLSQGTGAPAAPGLTVSPGAQPTVRLNAAGVFEIWDTGFNAWVPVTSTGGVLGTGAPEPA